MALTKITATNLGANAVNANSIGYTPANKAGDTFTGNTAFANNATILQNGSGRLIFRGYSGAAYRWNIDNSSGENAFRVFRENDSDASSGVVALSIDSNGRVTRPLQPSFCSAWGGSAYYTTTSGAAIKFGLTGGSGSVNGQTKQHNVGGHYSTATGMFTAPVAGVYNFSMASYHSTNNADSYVMLYVNGSNAFYTAGSQWGSGYNGINFSVNLSLSAGDYVHVVSGPALSMYGTSRFSGYLLG